MAGEFSLLSFPEPEDEAEVRRASLRFEELRKDALGPDDSVKLIEEILVEQYGP